MGLALKEYDKLKWHEDEVTFIIVLFIVTSKCVAHNMT
jgi:hypothetical protein